MCRLILQYVVICSVYCFSLFIFDAQCVYRYGRLNTQCLIAGQNVTLSGNGGVAVQGMVGNLCQSIARTFAYPFLMPYAIAFGKYIGGLIRCVASTGKVRMPVSDIPAIVTMNVSMLRMGDLIESVNEDGMGYSNT